MPEWVHIIIRTLISFCAMFVFARLIGKRQLSQITFFEYIVGIAIGDMAAIIPDELDAPLYHGLLPMAVYTALPIALSWVALKSKSARDFLEGHARVLIRDGKILEDNLKKERMSTDELLEHLRSKNVFKVADVEFALMESNGTVNVLVKSEQQPLTPKRMGLQVPPEVEPQAVIMDGQIMDEALATIGFNRAWLKTELEKQGVAVENVFLAQVDATGQLYIDVYEDKLKIPEPQTLPLTNITLKKAQADLESFALATADVQAKRMYTEAAERIQQVIDKVGPYLTR
ncbi:membrane protein [Alicyclobacillus tengchongensis]|nr:membrane protein [Alicyclobacillus tengchongensis]